MTTSNLVELDARGRVSLGKLAHHTRYLVSEEPDGVLILEPAVVMTSAQARLDQMPELSRQLTEAMAHPERGVPRRRRA